MLNYDALRGHLDNILAQMKEYQFQLQMVVFLLLYISYGKSSADMLLLSWGFIWCIYKLRIFTVCMYILYVLELGKNN